jgi:hypothetical protein
VSLHGPDPDLFRTKVSNARWYVDVLPADDVAPATDERWPSVTTIKKAWSKPFRKTLDTGERVSLDAYWAAEFIVDHLDTVESLADDRAAALTLVATSPARRLNAAAGRGTGVHTVMEDLMAGKGVGFVDPAVEPFVAGCKAFVEDWAPIPVASEFVVINRTIGFGGTGDAILTIQLNGGTWVVLVDYKSRGGEHGCYEEDVAQIGGYSLAEYMVVLGPDGRPMRMALPALDAGLVVSLTTEGYAAYPVDLGDAQAAFLDMRRSWEGHREGQKAARQARGNPLVLASNGTTGTTTERQTLSEPPVQDPSRENGDQPATGSDGGDTAPESEPAAGPTPEPGPIAQMPAKASARMDQMWEAVQEELAKQPDIWEPPLDEPYKHCALCDVAPGQEHLSTCMPKYGRRTHTQDQGPELLAARREWLKVRVDAIKAAGHAATLARFWSEHDEVPTFPKGGPTTAAEMDVVSQICWDTEGAHGMAFPPADDPAIAAFEAEAKAKGLV